MNFSVLSTDIAPVIQPCTVELPEHWYTFEKELGKYKDEFIKVHNQMQTVIGTLTDHVGDINRLQSVMQNISTDLSERISTVIDDYKEDSEIKSLQAKAEHLTGTCKAMEKILMNTNARRYAQFTCFACTETIADVCFDPCGHIMCRECWNQVRGTDCPVCRCEVVKPIRIFAI
jgi:hypothetical protein